MGENFKNMFALARRGLLVSLLVTPFAVGQNPAKSASASVAAPAAASPAGAAQPSDSTAPVESSGFDSVRQKARDNWQKQEADLKAQIDQTCNPTRISALVQKLQDARKPYDAANKSYWTYQKQLTDASLQAITENDSEDVYPIDDFKKDLDDSQKDLENKTKERTAAVALLKSLNDQLAQNGDKDTNLTGRIDAQKQLVESLDDVIKQATIEVEQKNLILERGKNIVGEKGALKERWRLIGELADKQIKAADDEATSVKQINQLYGTRRQSSCLTAAQKQPSKP